MPIVLDKTLTLKDRGQLVLPLWIRKKKKLNTGTKFYIKLVGDQIILIPKDINQFLNKWRGSMSADLNPQEEERIEAKREKILNPK